MDLLQEKKPVIDMKWLCNRKLQNPNNDSKIEMFRCTEFNKYSITAPHKKRP